MGKLARSTGAKITNANSLDGIIKFLSRAVGFSRNPYSIKEKVKKQEEISNVKSATKRVEDETELVKAETDFEKAATGYVEALGGYGQQTGKRLIAANNQKTKLYAVAGDLRESEKDLHLAEGDYNRRKEEAYLAARTKNNVFK